MQQNTIQTPQLFLKLDDSLHRFADTAENDSRVDVVGMLSFKNCWGFIFPL